MGAFLGILYGIISVLLNRQLIAFFQLNSPKVVWDARVYLMIVCGLVVFSCFPWTSIGRNSGSYGKYSYDISGNDHRAFD